MGEMRRLLHFRNVAAVIPAGPAPCPGRSVALSAFVRSGALQRRNPFNLGVAKVQDTWVLQDTWILESMIRRARSGSGNRLSGESCSNKTLERRVDPPNTHPALIPLEILYRALVPLRGGARPEGAEIAPPPRLRILLPRIKPVFAGGKLADHGSVSRCLFVFKPRYASWFLLSLCAK